MTKEFDENAINALKSIDFVTRYSKLTGKYPFHVEEVEELKKINVLEVFKDLGYKFKHAEQSYIYREVIDRENEYQITINCKYNRFTCYFIVKRSGVYIKLDSGNLGFILKYLQNDESPISLPWFRTITEFKAITSDILELYEDFKRELSSLD